MNYELPVPTFSLRNNKVLRLLESQFLRCYGRIIQSIRTHSYPLGHDPSGIDGDGNTGPADLMRFSIFLMLVSLLILSESGVTHKSQHGSASLWSTCFPSGFVAVENFGCLCATSMRPPSLLSWPRYRRCWLLHMSLVELWTLGALIILFALIFVSANSD